MKDNLNFHGFEICVILRCTCLPDIIWFKEKKYLVYHGFLATCTEEQSRLFVKNFQRNWNWKSKKIKNCPDWSSMFVCFLNINRNFDTNSPLSYFSSATCYTPYLPHPYLPHFYFLEATGLIDNYGWSHLNIKQLRAR